MAELELSALLKMLENPAQAVADAEKLYHARVRTVAEHVQKNKIRVLMLAGPSASGKTTTANLIADAIRANGEDAMVVSLDCFYRNADDPLYPKLDNGMRNMEHPEALDIPLLHRTLDDMIKGRDFVIPKYDFTCGMRNGEDRYPSKAEECVIVEGIHALNPLINGTLPADKSLKLFVSVSTNINESGDRQISGKKMRFVRRLVRDNLYRGMSAERTIRVWDGVVDGEEKYLYPYKPLADMAFDTFHAFELAVLKPFAERLLTPDVTAASPYAEVIHGLIRRIPAMPLDPVPEDSLIREFIPGGIYESLY